MRDRLKCHASYFALSAGTCLSSFTPSMFAQARDGTGNTPAPRLQLVGQPQRVYPKRVARMGPDFKIIGDWHDVSPDDLLSPADGPPLALAFDCFEPDESGEPTDGNYFEDCGMDSYRWYFGSTFVNPFAVNDMTLAEGFEGKESQRIEFAWYGAHAPTPFVGIFTADYFDDSCSASGFDLFMGGVVFDFGDALFGYTYVDVDLAALGLSLPLPSDGRGAYGIILADEYNPVFGFTKLSDYAQPMLWGTKLLNPSQQGPHQWDDIDPTDFAFTANECRDYAYGECPDPLGSMVCFYAPAPEGYCATNLATSPLVAGQDSRFTVVSPNPGRQVAVFFSFNSGTFSHDFVNQNYCLDLALQLPPDPRSNLVCTMTLDATGKAQKNIPIPLWARGAHVYFQAALQGTCPDSCSSNVVEAVIE